jgi:hypothetical protein
MISVQEAIQRAANFAKNVLDEARASDLRVEELEGSKLGGDDVWLITLSMPRESFTLGALESLRKPRDFKTFTVHGTSGEVLSMKIRELAGVE